MIPCSLFDALEHASNIFGMTEVKWFGNSCNKHKTLLWFHGTDGMGTTYSWTISHKTMSNNIYGHQLGLNQLYDKTSKDLPALPRF